MALRTPQYFEFILFLPLVFPTPPFAAMAFRLPVIFDFGVQAQPVAGKSAEQWIASAEEERPFLFKK